MLFTHMVQVFLPLLLELTQPMILILYILKKVWWKRDGCLAFEKPPFEKKPGQAGARKRYTTCLRHRAHCHPIISIDHLIKI
jgi:hypothetical protein